MNVCFTGHRHIKIDKSFEKKLYGKLEYLIENGALRFYAGGALGFDMFCEEAVIRLRRKYPQISLHLVLPCPIDEQTMKWSDRDKFKYNMIIDEADTVEFTSEHYTSDCMKIRNAKLVEYADYCICCFNGKFPSGTGQTVNFAKNKKIDIYNILDDE